MKKLFIFLFITTNSIFILAQKKNTYFDKATTIEVTSGSDSIQAMLDDYERIQLPPLSVFLESVYDHPSVKIYEAKRDEANADMKVTRREWLNYSGHTVNTNMVELYNYLPGKPLKILRFLPV